jgi:hypothetical protein
MRLFSCFLQCRLVSAAGDCLHAYEPESISE